MEVKLLEVRDRLTFIPVIAIAMLPGPKRDWLHVSDAAKEMSRADNARRWLLRKAGYADDERHPTIALAHLGAAKTADRASGKTFCCDPYDWCDRTYQCAHLYIEKNWHELKDGDVVDVEFILGETKEPKVSEIAERP
jgi:hypothetical protein